MDTRILNEAEKKEHFDSPAELDKKVEQLAMMVLSAEHFCAFTGAGLSTGAGIPDYRSGVNTATGLGAGKWEREALMDEAKKAGKKIEIKVPTGKRV